MAVLLFTVGFIMFATVGTRPPAVADPRADGIVVLTGESRRITEGARLLKEGRAERMLISGVFRHTGKRALIKISGLPEQKFDCCVDVGYTAHDTAGNANEARSWATQRHYASLIVVTASYHMPRTLLELQAVLPDIKFVPYPVFPEHVKLNHWWADPRTTAVLMGEYGKYLASLVRVNAATTLGLQSAAEPAPSTIERGTTPPAHAGDAASADTSSK